MMDVLFFALYRVIAIPCALFVLRLARPFLPRKLQEMVIVRKKDGAAQTWPELPARPILIHAASGEIEYAKSVIRSLRQQWPQRPIVVSYFSPSAKRLFKNISGVAAFIPLPFDHRDDMAEFFNKLNPQLVLIARTDVWPEFIYQCGKRNIPSLLFAATLAADSSRSRGIAKVLNRFALNHLSKIHCVSEQDKLLLMSLGVQTPIVVAGDTRFDQVLWRDLHPQHEFTDFKVQSHPTLVLGSTWPEDEMRLLPALPDFCRHGGRVILAPHEVTPEHLDSLTVQLAQMQLSTERLSHLTEAWTSTVLLVDQVGYLADIYSIGDFAFVGGSFKQRVHSVMEPLAAGLPVAVGPFHINNREALLFQGLGAVHVVNDQKAWHELLSRWQNENWPQSELRTHIQQLVQKQAGATAKILLDPLISSAIQAST